jgi:hypothetical protein
MGQAKNPQRRPAARPDALMARIDRALSSWPAAGSDALDADEKAAQIVARAMEEGGGDSSEPDVLGPPLPRLGEPGEVTGSRGPVRRWMGSGAVALLAAAAVAAGGLFFWLRPATEPGALSSSASSSSSGADRRVAAASPAAGVATAAARPAPVDAPGIDPSELPVASSGVVVAPRAVAQGTARATGASRAAAPAAVAAPAQAEAPAWDDSLQPAAAVAPGSSLSGIASSVPRRPSVGAIQGALGAALPSARACLEAGDPPYHVTVTFQSNGNVQGVSFQNAGGAGHAAESAAEACVRAALGKAQVAPFAEATYAAPLTVRH